MTNTREPALVAPPAGSDVTLKSRLRRYSANFAISKIPVQTRPSHRQDGSPKTHPSQERYAKVRPDCVGAGLQPGLLRIMRNFKMREGPKNPPFPPQSPLLASIPTTRINLPLASRMPALALNIRNLLHRFALHAAVFLVRMTRTIRMRALLRSVSHSSSFPLAVSIPLIAGSIAYRTVAVLPFPFLSLNSKIISRLNARISSGRRLLTQLRWRITLRSSHSAPNPYAGELSDSGHGLLLSPHDKLRPWSLYRS